MTLDFPRRHTSNRGARLHVVGYNRPGPGGRAFADRHRRPQHRVASNERAVLDDGAVLFLTVKVARDGPSSDHDVFAHLGVAKIAEVSHTRSGSDCRAPYLRVVSDFCAGTYAGMRTEVCIRSNARSIQDLRLLHGGSGDP